MLFNFIIVPANAVIELIKVRKEEVIIITVGR